MLLKRQVAVDSYEDIEFGLSQSQQLAVGDSCPALADDGMNFDRLNMFGKPTIHTLVEELSSGFADRQSRSPLKKRHDAFSRDRGKSTKELIDRVTGLDIVEQGLHGDARARKHWRSAHDVRRSANHGSTHMGLR